MNSRKCDVCIIDLHRASYAKHLRNKTKLDIEKQNELIMPEGLFKEPIESKIKNVYNPKSKKQIAIENIKLDDKQLNKERAKRMVNPYYFTDRLIQVGFFYKPS